MRHADPRALDHHFTIGRVLALAWRAGGACWWQIVLLCVPTAVADVSVRWFLFNHIGQTLSARWQEMIYLWAAVPVSCIGFVGVVCANLSFVRNQRASIRGALNIPWRRMPAILAAGLILQTATYWPSPLLSWPDKEGSGLLLVDYSILAINVLTIDVLSFVFMPVLLTENQSLIGTFRRSVQLVVNHPWRILAIDLGLWAVYFVYSFASEQTYAVIDPSWINIAWSAATGVWLAIMLPVTCCLVTAAYHLLRNEQEGPAAETLARVFE